MNLVQGVQSNRRPNVSFSVEKEHIKLPAVNRRDQVGVVKFFNDVIMHHREREQAQCKQVPSKSSYVDLLLLVDSQSIESAEMPGASRLTSD